MTLCDASSVYKNRKMTGAPVGAEWSKPVQCLSSHLRCTIREVVRLLGTCMPAHTKIVCSEDAPTSEEHSTGSSDQVREACACCIGGRTNACDQERKEPMSSNMVVMTFSNAYTAEQVRDRLFEMQKAHLIKVDDKEGDHDMLRRRPDEQLGPRAGRGGRYLM